MTALAVMRGVAVGLLMANAVTAQAQQARVCGRDSVQPAMLVETVQDRQTHVPLSGALVTAQWVGREEAQRAHTDSAGKVWICAPTDRLITLRVSYHNVRAGPLTTVLTRAHPTEHTFPVDAPAALLRGVVVQKETGDPLHNVAVRLRNTPLMAITDAAGRFHFERVPFGDYRIEVEHVAYATVRTALLVRAHDLDALIQLVPATIPMEPVIVSAFSLRLEQIGFYEREKRGVGTFLGREQIDAMNAQRASDLLRRVPSARIVPQASRRNAPANLTYGRGNCRYRFIVDGARTLPDFEMDLMAPSAIEGVEVYNGLSEVPALFREISSGGAGYALCGVVVIWTRDRR